jgi:hypothetical protein
VLWICGDAVAVAAAEALPLYLTCRPAAAQKTRVSFPLPCPPNPSLLHAPRISLSAAPVFTVVPPSVQKESCSQEQTAFKTDETILS